MADPTQLSAAMHQVIEPINSIAYFHPRMMKAWEEVGLEPLTHGYFGGRGAPLGFVGPEVVAAAFFNFSPAQVALGVPQVWEVASPAQVLATRAHGMQAVLEELEVPTDGVEEATDLAHQAVEAAPTAGRPLAAGNSAVPLSGQPLADLWQAVTTLREHRGDGHVALLVGECLTPVEALVLYANWPEGPRRRFLQASRGWDDDAWEAAHDRLAADGLMDDDGLTEGGMAYRRGLEDLTDEAAAAPWEALGPDTTRRLWELLQPIAARAGEAFPRPVTVPERFPIS